MYLCHQPAREQCGLLVKGFSNLLQKGNGWCLSFQLSCVLDKWVFRLTRGVPAPGQTLEPLEESGFVLALLPGWLFVSVVRRKVGASSAELSLHPDGLFCHIRSQEVKAFHSLLSASVQQISSGFMGLYGP